MNSIYFLTIKHVFVFSFMVFISGIAYSNNADTTGVFDEIVVTATRTHVPLWRTPVPVSVITGAELERRGGINLGDMLERSETVSLQRYGAGAALTTISIRGAATDQTVVLLNGIRLNSPQNGLVDLSTLPVNDIERIEIVRGGASSLYGNHAMGGVVNIITRGDTYNGPIAALNIGGGSFGLRRIRVQSNINTTRMDLSVGLGRDQWDGDFPFKNPVGEEGFIKRSNADYVQSFATLDGHVRINDESMLGFFIRYSAADRGLPGPFFGTQSEDRQEDEHLHTAISISRNVSEHVVMTLRPFLIYSELTYISPEWDFISHSKNRELGGVFDVDAQLSPGVLMTFGGEISEAKVNADALAGEAGRLNTVAYLSGEWSLPQAGDINTTLFPSVRYDRFSNIKEGGERRIYEEITWKLGVSVQPFRYERFLVRGSIGRNFKAPGLNDMYWVPGGNENLVPERSIGLDAGIRYELPFLQGLMIDAGYFTSRTNDRIVWIPGDDDPFIWSPVNLRKVHADGFEADLRWRPMSLPVRFGVSYLHQNVRQYIRDETTGTETAQRLIYIPGSMISGEFGYDMSDFRFSFFPRYTGKRYTTDINDDYVEQFFVIDFRSDYRVRFGQFNALIGVEARNLFNTDYQIIQRYPMPGRHYELNIRMSH